MSNDVVLDVNTRDVLGKKVKHLRNEGKVPGVIQDHGKKSIHVTLDYRDFAKAFHQAGRHQPVALNVGGKKHVAMIREVTHEPTKHLIQHVVFTAIKQNEKVQAEVPIILTGEEVPAEIAGNMVIDGINTVSVLALPKNLPESYQVDKASLSEVGDKITVADLPVIEGVEITTDAETVIAQVEQPRTHEQVVEEEGDVTVPSSESEAKDVESEHGSAENDDSPEGETS